jgi:CheY-like chemotaxis protein
VKTILVADDEFDMTSTLQAILEDEGYHVLICADGREALERICATRPDLVLMDVMMPLLSGFEVLGAMRASPGLESVPVVLMSVIAPGVRREDYPWHAFLRKPFGVDLLTRTIEKLIGKPVAG